MASNTYTEWEKEFFKKHIPNWQPGLSDGIEFYHSKEEARAVERGWAQFAAHVRDNEKQFPSGFHHMGMFWADIYLVLPPSQYKPGVLRVAHMKLGPKNIKCLREECLPNGRIRWVLSFHHEGICPACQRMSLGKRPEPAKLLRSNRVASEPEQTNNQPKLMLRNK